LKVNTPAALRTTGYFARSYRRTWRASVVTTFVSPTLYLLAMGVGLGSFVDSNGHTASLGGVTYLQYVAPGLAAVAATTTAAGESLFPVMGAIKWQRTYLAMLSTPLRVGDILGGHLIWMAARVTMAVTAYVVVMVAFSATPSSQVAGVVPAGLLTGMAFAAPFAAFAATQDSEGAFTLIFRIGIVPLFLFSGVFFPISSLPSGLRALAHLSPLWHGVDLCRNFALGTSTVGEVLSHVVYLSAFVVSGVLAARITYRRRLYT
jgi:lipooligosaccharide transport system permease protein